MATPARPYGVLGRSLAHSYTPAIYRMLADMEYVRFEREPDEVERFIHSDEWEGVNVTIPYKRTVVPFMDELSDTARRLGNVNTIVRLPDGRLHGDNTDYYGFKFLLDALECPVAGAQVLVFGGMGGAGSTCMTVLRDMGAQPVAISRQGAVTYEDLHRYADARLIVNATPVGMYPACPASVYSLDRFPSLTALVDIVYNPARTGLIIQAEERGIPHIGGLMMLVAQAAAAVRAYTGEEISRTRIQEVTQTLEAQTLNIALIGMPGAGKTKVGRALAALLHRTHVDLDDAFEAHVGMACNPYIRTRGEEAFRAAETEVLADVAKQSGLVISCGGGIVTRDENYPLLHQNSRIVMLDRPLDELSSTGRPISQRDGIEALARTRLPRYRVWADLVITSRESADATAHALLDLLF